MWNRHNVHKMFINIYRNPKTRNSRNYETLLFIKYEKLYDFLVQAQNFWVKPLSKRFFDVRRERDTIFLCWLLLHRQLSTQPTGGARSAQIRLASASSECRLYPSEAGTQLTAFLKSQKSSAHAPGAWCHSHPMVPIFYLGFLFWYLWMTHPLHARAWTPAFMLHLTNACAKRKVLSLTKPIGKIYKTKSLGHYITSLFQFKGLLLKSNVWISGDSRSGAFLFQKGVSSWCNG